MGMGGEITRQKGRILMLGDIGNLSIVSRKDGLKKMREVQAREAIKGGYDVKAIYLLP